MNFMFKVLAAGILISLARTSSFCDPDTYWKSVRADEGADVRAFAFDVDSYGNMVLGGSRDFSGSWQDAFVQMQNSEDCGLKWSYETRTFDRFYFVDFDPTEQMVVAVAQAQLTVDDVTDTSQENYFVTFEKVTGIVKTVTITSVGSGFNNNIFDGFFSPFNSVYTIGKEADGATGQSIYNYGLE